MGFRKVILVFLVFFVQLHLLPASSYPLQNPFATDFNQEQNVGSKQQREKLSTKVRIGREISVSRRGGAAGGHGGHSGHGGHGGMSGGKGSHGSNGHGDGTKSPKLQGGAATAIIPLYAAGAMNQHHRNYNHHHGTNSGTNNYIGLTYLAFTLLSTLLLLHFT